MARAFKETFSEVKIASPYKRLAAMVYDTLLLMAIWMIAGFVAVASNQGQAQISPIFHSILFILSYAFFSYCWLRSGQTLGMLAWRLRVQTTEAEALSLWQTLWRFLAGCLGLVSFGLGYLWMFIDRQNRSWSDIASNSCVVELPKKNKLIGTP